MIVVLEASAMPNVESLLRRLRLKGLITRVPKLHRYLLTPSGRRVAIFMSKSFTRLVRPVLHRVDPPCLPTPMTPSAAPGSPSNAKSTA